MDLASYCESFMPMHGSSYCSRSRSLANHVSQNPTAWDLQGKAALIASSVSTLLIVWAYFRLPETNQKTYEELDLLFEAGVPAREFKNYDTTELKLRAVEELK